MDSVSIRLATVDDLDPIMVLAQEICEENGFLKASAEMLVREFWPALNQDHGLCAVIGEPGKTIEGLVLLRIGTMWYSKETVLEEKVLCVSAPYRAAKGGRARKLCAFSKQTAISLGLPLLIGVLSDTRTQGKLKMYTREFGAPSGAFFLFGRTTGGHGFA